MTTTARLQPWYSPKSLHLYPTWHALPLGLILSSGNTWVDNRRFTHYRYISRIWSWETVDREHHYGGSERVDSSHVRDFRTAVGYWAVFQSGVFQCDVVGGCWRTLQPWWSETDRTSESTAPVCRSCLPTCTTLLTVATTSWHDPLLSQGSSNLFKWETESRLARLIFFSLPAPSWGFLFLISLSALRKSLRFIFVWLRWRILAQEAGKPQISQYNFADNVLSPCGQDKIGFRYLKESNYESYAMSLRNYSSYGKGWPLFGFCWKLFLAHLGWVPARNPNKSDKLWAWLSSSTRHNWNVFDMISTQ